MNAADVAWLCFLVVVCLMIVLHEAGKQPKDPYERRQNWRRRK